MAQLLKSARLLVSDLAATIAFLAVLVATKELMLAVVIGVALGAAQIGWLFARGRPIAAMQWLSIGLVVVSGVATLLTSDARFVMLKPSVEYCVTGAFMLRRGWMNRYLPPIAIEVVPDLVYGLGFVWAGLMFATAALNILLALTLDPLTWSITLLVWGIASKLALFVGQFAVMRTIGARRRAPSLAANIRYRPEEA